MPIRVLVISNYNDFHTARPEASIFLGLAKLDFEIFVMTYKDCQLARDFEAAGIQVIDFHPEKKFDKIEVKTIRDFIVENRIDILHVFNSISTVNGIRAAKGLDVKVVLYRGFAGNINWYDPSAYIKYLHPRVDKIFCNSIGVEKYIQKQLFFDKRKTITINKGHDIEWYQGYDPYDIRKELGLDSNSFLVINVANNRRMKGIPYLLKAFNTLPEGLPVHLLLAGNDMETVENLKIVSSGKHADKVHFLGFRKNVLNIVSSCNVFALSSIRGESITKSVIEAMSLGVPAIITDIPGNVELLEHGKSGLVVPSKDYVSLGKAILQIYEDKALCKKLGVGAKEWIATELNYKKTIQKTKKMYEDLVATN